MTALTEGEGQAALELARRALESALRGQRIPLPTLPSVFDEKRGVFVTIKENELLRGCIGLPYPIMPLRDAIVEAAVSAATQDPRFPPVTEEELPRIQLEVTILTTPQPLMGSPAQRPEMVKVGTHGLIVKGWGSSGLLLPQVPGEYNWDSQEFLSHTCMKAGLPADCWKY
ncbi:MAG TPA: TIGR00296 family protein, partial [Methanomicrobiales archaeon]|nr:TIGR00296 family protein [Methanomicrobiales archaeon]